MLPGIRSLAVSMHLEIHWVYAPGDAFTCRRAATRNLLGIALQIMHSVGQSMVKSKCKLIIVWLFC
ncbi:hypothetical protein PAU_01929 [Photorhabdus asymbiotica]|uniref:Uncharacterized protein n=1 Tax=Photorhabdus asymbiotica subsp. asymbiotica (strain ATCC 43949 / 3105-77) TaxID=553480 RepID=C7BHS4_PHOAA|nr:hypothetical protein PAU_01929 [Photorhabdus asymbiotica]